MTKKEFRNDLRVIDSGITRALRRALELQKTNNADSLSTSRAYEEASKEWQNFRAVTLTNFWVAEAGRRFVPGPPEGDPRYWRPLPAQPPALEDTPVLTQEGITFIRRQLREDSRSAIAAAATIISTLTGLGGILIGLLSLFLK